MRKETSTSDISRYDNGDSFETRDILRYLLGLQSGFNDKPAFDALRVLHL